MQTSFPRGELGPDKVAPLTTHENETKSKKRSREGNDQVDITVCCILYVHGNDFEWKTVNQSLLSHQQRVKRIVFFVQC